MLQFVYHNQIYPIEYEDEDVDIEILYSFALSIVETENITLLQLPDILLLKTESLPRTFSFTKPIFIITQEETVPVDEDYYYCCSKQVSSKPFLQETKNTICKPCLEICNQQIIQKESLIPLFTSCKCSPTRCIYIENTEEIEMDENQRRSYIHQETNKASFHVFINWLRNEIQKYPERSIQQRLLHQIVFYSKITAMYEDPNNQQKALEHVPLQELHITQQQINEKSLDTEEMKVIVDWFKTKFFKWFEMKCEKCQSKNLYEYDGEPNTEERANIASRVEVYRCKDCGNIKRFPRYNNPLKLLETRVGRCGEFGNCFALICRSLGYQVRLIIDSTDHVWIEFYSKKEERYIHVDPCENKVDYPLTYEKGWGKKLQYIIGINQQEVVDVTKRYTEHFDDCMTRRESSFENYFKEVCETYSLISSVYCDSFDVCQWRKNDYDELEGIIKREKRWEAIGRISGDQAWKRERGESGIGINKQMFTKSLPINFSFVGESYYSSNFNGIVLTENYSSAGGIWKEIEGNDIYLKFDVQNIQAEADGFAVVLQNEGNNVIGSCGSGKGYRNIKGGIVIEFSLYSNYDIHDPNRYHVAILTQNQSGLLSDDHLNCVDCCLQPKCYWDGKNHCIEVIITSTSICCWIDGIVTCFMENAEVLDNIWKQKKWIGITAGTGGLKNICVVKNIQLFTSH